jgi:general stress protein YciG
MEVRPEDDEGRDDEPEVPETPPDEPRPPRIDDPPPHDSKGPYVVHAHSEQNREAVVNTGERKERRGFASMSPEKQREIASKGGRAAHEKGTAHEWSAEEARSAGRKGGQVSRGGRGRLVVSPADASPTAGQPAGDATSSER